MSTRPNFPIASAVFGDCNVWVATNVPDVVVSTTAAANAPEVPDVNGWLVTIQDGATIAKFVVAHDIIAQVIDTITLEQPEGTDWIAWSIHLLTEVVPDWAREVGP